MKNRFKPALNFPAFSGPHEGSELGSPSLTPRFSARKVSGQREAVAQKAKFPAVSTPYLAYPTRSDQIQLTFLRLPRTLAVKKRS